MFFGGRFFQTINRKIKKGLTGAHSSGGKGRKRGQEGK